MTPRSAVMAQSLVLVGGLVLAVVPGCGTSRGVERDDDRPLADDLDDEERATFDAAVDEIASLEAERGTPSALEPYLDPTGHEEIRYRAARALARVEHQDAADPLLVAMADPSPRVRAMAAFGLGQLDGALEVGRDAHDAVRAGVERLLVFSLDKEDDPAVRRALLRSLGRVATGPGLDGLKRLAAAPGPERAVALTALGVSGSRRGASLRLDPMLAEVVSSSLAEKDVEVRRAAAYVVFRQKMRLPERAVDVLAARGDGQTLIHLLRALAGGSGPRELATPLLEHADWRVRVEAARVLGGQGPVPVAPLVAAVDRAAARLEAGEAGGDAHVVHIGCLALINAPAEETRPTFRRVSDRLAKIRPDAGCACAIAHDAQQARIELVRSCAPSWSEERVRRLGVAVAHRSMISTREKAGWLKTALEDASRHVRLDAADALAEEATAAAAEVAANALATERDPAVAGALLRTMTGEHENALDTAVLVAVLERFIGAKNVEETEPLLEGARLLQHRSGFGVDEILARLLAHPDYHVRLRAAGTPFGDREHAPFAVTEPPPEADTLPSYAVLRTDRGRIRIRFERAIAPGTVANFVSLVERGVLNDTPFHRVVPDFVAQGGDPRGDGTGGPGYTIGCENHDGAYTRGAVGMALAGKDTGGSQFFLTHSEQPHLDGRYTLFGRVVEGAEVMDEIGPDDRLLGVTLEREGDP